MAAKMSILFVLLALCVAASMQMPDHGARSRVRRQAKGTEEPETSEASPPASTGNANAGGDASPGGGGFNSMGGGNSGGVIPGQELFSSFLQAFFGNADQLPGSSFWQQLMPGKSRSI